MNKRKWLGLVVALGLIVAACGGSPPATTSAPGTTQPPATTQPTAPSVPAGSGGELKLIMWQAPDTLNNFLSSGTKDTMGASLIIEPLASFGPDTGIVPKLALEVPTLDNGGQAADLMSVTWKLKQGVVWSDGTPFTADDVVFTWQYCTDEATGCAQADAFNGVTNVEAVDAHSVKITFASATAYPYLPFVGATSSIIQKAQFEECIGEAARGCTAQNFAPIGTGPFKVKEFRTGDTVVYDFNDRYRDNEDGKPFFGTVTILGGGDAEAAARRTLVLREADYSWNLQVPPDILIPMEQEGHGSLEVAFAGNIEHINLNQTNWKNAVPSDWQNGNNPHPVFRGEDAVEFTRALSIAIDREVLTERGYGVAGAPTCNIWPAPPAISTTHDWCKEFDIAEANRILDGLGYERNADNIRVHPEFGPLIFTYNTSTNAVRQTFQALIKDWWSQIGIGTEMRDTEATVFFGGGVAADNITRFDGDMQMYTFVPLPGGQSHFAGYTTSAIPHPGNNFAGANLLRYSNTAYDALYQQLSSTTDPDQRNDLIKQLSDTVIADGAIIPLVWRASASAFSNDLKGWDQLNGWDTEFWNIADWYK